MAATIQIHEMSGADAGTDKTSGTVRFKMADNATVDANNPMVIPGAGSDYSYTKKLRAYMEAPPNTQVGNLRWYSDGSKGWSAEILMSYKNIGTTFGSQYDTAMSGSTDFFSKTSGSPIDGDGTDAGPFVPADDNTYIGDIIEFQMTITSASTQGTLANESCTLAYDEI